jgi:SNF2 family DNA or RNA helicase
MFWLPTLGATAVPSSPLIAEVAEPRAKPGLMPWWITTVPLAADQAIALLGAVGTRPTLAPGVLVGRDLAYWATALRLAGALVARQRFLPGLVQRNGAWRACWEPVITGDDVKRVADAAKQMPPVARAISTNDATVPPELPGESVLTAFLAAMVDYLVRSTGENVPGMVEPARRPRGKSPQFDSLHDQWLHALRSPEGRMEGDADELAQLAEQIQRWRRPILMTATAPVRLCFRLEEPEVAAFEEGKQSTMAQLAVAQSASPWHVRYLLQAADDPSLLVPAEDAWGQRGRRAAVLKRKGFQTQEYLLSALGQAAGICPRIEASLKTAQPGGYEVDATGAHEFLTERAAALEQAGFGVLLPAWWTRKGTKLRLSVRANVKSPKMQGATGISLGALVNFRWEVALGDESLSLKELEALAKLKQPLVKVRGQWVQMSADEIQTALEFWKKRAPETATVRDVVKMALGADGATRDVDFAGVQAEGWVADLLGKLEGTTAFEELATPSEFQGDLRPYQVRGYSWLAFLQRWGLGACLADDMGLGKTVQTLALIQDHWTAGNRRPMLLICPTSVVGNWQKEAARFTPDLPVMIHHGTTRAKQAAFKKAAAGQALVISSYALLHRDLAYLQDVDWAGVILDEAQNIKNPETKQAKAARTLKADCHIALTGTPVENHVGDLWSIMEFLNPGFLGTQAEFKQRFFVPIQAMRDAEATERLKRLTSPFLLRRLKTDKQVIADLPDKLEMKVFCTLTKEQASLYTAVLREAEEALADSEGIQRKGMILGMLSKLKQVCNHPAQFLGDNSSVPGRSGKLARLTEMLEESLEVGDRALLFSQFTEMGQILVRYLEETFGREVLFLHGGVPKRRRDAMVERFQSADGPPLFVLSLKAGGTGLNLTRANHVFHFDRWWNPAVENQATDRAFRIGQTRNVQVHKFLCVGTFEERIDEMIESKKEIAEQVVGAGEGWLTELSNRQLRDLFALRQEAVGV